MTTSTGSEISHQVEGFTLVELVVSMFVFIIISLSLSGLFISLVRSASVAQRKAVADTLATNQMEYLKSLPYNDLAVAGGSIYSNNLLPATTTNTINGVKYTVTTSINYIDDAYNGCGPYPNQTLKQQYCRNYPPPAGAPAVGDSNDYKIVDVSVSDYTNNVLAAVDTEIAAKVAETASTTGALFVKVVDGSGAPVTGATVNVVNNSLSPALNLSDTSDENGIVIFYNLPPDTANYHYAITASKSGYSTLATIAPNGSLQPTYSNQNILVQQSSLVTMTILLQGSNSLVLESTDTSGNPLPNVKVYVKGGYKKYTSTLDTQYYYDNMNPSDTRPTTDTNGLAAVTNLVPGTYIFCGDNADTGCSIGGTTYYLVAAVPYSGSNPLNPVIVPTFDPNNPPSTTFSYNSVSYLQKVRLMFTTNQNFPRVITLIPSEISQGLGDLDAFNFQITGINLPCGSSSCATTVSLVQNSNTYTASCTGTNNTHLACTVDISSAGLGSTQLVVSANGYTLTLPAAPLLGGINVVP
jgi:type II secretory pathway pseudopilin PulG